MPDDRRSARRARLSGIRVSYESSTGESRLADVANLSREGVFIASATPLAVGKRLALEIQVAGEAAPWAALGRVVWSREVGEGDDLPGGMAVKFIDVDDAVVAAIERLIETREPTEPGLGERAAASADRGPPRREPPRREKTMVGVGIATASPAAPVAPAAPGRAVADAPSPAKPAAPGRAGSVAAAPAPRPMPSRERTIVGVGTGAASDEDPREPSLAIDLVARKPPSTRPPSAPEEAPAAETAPPATAEASDTAPIVTATERDIAPASATPETDPTTSAPDPAPTRARKTSLESEPDRVEANVDREVSEAPLPRRRSGGGWLLVLLLLIACGVAGYAFRDRLLPFWYIAVRAIRQRLH